VSRNYRAVNVHFFSRVALAGLSVVLALGSLFGSRRALEPRTSSPTIEDDHLVAADGFRLPLSSFAPAGRPEAFVVGLHGFADCRDSLSATGAWFASHGIAFYAYDQRGFGETESHGKWPGIQPLILDLADATTVLRVRHGEIPGIVLGESMGASVVLAGAGQGALTGLDAIVAVSPGVCGGLSGRRVQDQGLRLAAPGLPWFAREVEQGGQPWLQPAAVERLAHDPRVLRRLDTATHPGLVELMRVASALPKAPMPPTLVVRGELDTTISDVAVRDLMVKLGGTGVQRTYPECHHLILQSREYELVLQDCLDWLIATLRTS
jgi:alpha-beta hydrolase superfamily lysophospholipase